MVLSFYCPQCIACLQFLSHPSKSAETLNILTRKQQLCSSLCYCVVNCFFFFVVVYLQVARKLVVLEGDLERSEERAEVAEA